MIETEFVQGSIVGGATGIVRSGTSFARAIQTGYLRAYALLLLLGVAALTLYFLIGELVTIHLSIVLFLPLAAGLIGRFPAARLARWAVLAGTLGVLAYAIVMLVDFEPAAGLQYVTDDEWISELGIRYKLGVDGLNLFMIALTAIAWVPCTLVGGVPRGERPRLFFFHLALAETAVLGAFMAQDLALFIVFFDLMLVPFYFLIGGWGSGDRVRATTQVRDLHAGGLAADAGGGDRARGAGRARRRRDLVLALGPRSGARSPRARSTGSCCCSRWRSSSRPAVPAARLGAGDLSLDAHPRARTALGRAVEGRRLRLPADRAAGHAGGRPALAGAVHRVAVFSILYGSVLAFSQDNVRLVVAYSSIAQLGFIVLGIFALERRAPRARSSRWSTTAWSSSRCS